MDGADFLTGAADADADADADARAAGLNLLGAAAGLDLLDLGTCG
jgi:hypothetical protein